MSRPDVAVRPVLASAGAIALVIAVAIGVVFALLAAWHEPAGGMASGGAALVRSLRAIGPALQSAPQAERAARAASTVARSPASVPGSGP